MSKNKTYELGTAIKITTVLSLASPTSVKITIKDPSNLTEVSATSMTSQTTTIYSYIYQSSTSDTEGKYKVIIDAVYGSYTSRATAIFEMVDNDP